MIKNRIAMDAQYFEADEEHAVLAVPNKSVIEETYDCFKFINKKAIRFHRKEQSINIQTPGTSKHSRIKLPPHSKFYVYLISGGECSECGARIGLQYDHIFPFSLGGSNETGNFQILCDRCNKNKSNKI